ncbi:MAG: hypothetical protein N3B01_10250, partial [Verrucomicrobiae bacterium]|nr:hypothetical protein [Verrucomicrobiae bacterium]
DVHGLAEQFVERYLGDGVVAPGFAGASGDIDPWFRVLPEIRTVNGWIPEPVLLGTMLGEEVVHTASRISEFWQDGPIRCVMKTVNLPSKGDRTATVPFGLSVARLGRVAFVGLGGEVFHQIGRGIKKASPFPYTFVITHCNGAAGYLVVKQAYEEGGYEVRSSPFAPEAEEIVLGEVRSLLQLLWGG